MPRSEFGWSLCYLSEVSLVVAWLLKCNMSRLFLWTSIQFLKKCGTHISCVHNRLFISSECPFHTLGTGVHYFQVYIIIFFFLWLQRSIGQPKVIFLQFKKIIIKKTDNQKKKFMTPVCPTWSFLSLDFFRRDADLYSELGIDFKSNLGRPPI